MQTQPPKWSDRARLWWATGVFSSSKRASPHHTTPLFSTSTSTSLPKTSTEEAKHPPPPFFCLKLQCIFFACTCLCISDPIFLFTFVCPPLETKPIYSNTQNLFIGVNTIVHVSTCWSYDKVSCGGQTVTKLLTGVIPSVGHWSVVASCITVKQ